MSSQHGNVKKTGAPKHKNRTAFKNTLHDHSKRTLQLVAMNVTGCCSRCKEIIDWKIKYKKYKPLGQPRKWTLNRLSLMSQNTLVRCLQKTVTRAYYVICESCAKKDGICAKCTEKKDIVQEPELTPLQQAARQTQVEQELRFMSERQRRTFQRYVESGHQTSDGAQAPDGSDSESEQEEDEDEVEDKQTD